MAETKLIRDHHLLTRNLRLNGNYISNDGDDEGISISDNGAVAITDGTATLSLGGTGATSLSAATTVDLDGTGNIALNSSGGTIGIGNDAVAQAINIGTGAAARTITIGNETGATALVLKSGTGKTDITGALVVDYDEPSTQPWVTNVGMQFYIDKTEAISSGTNRVKGMAFDLNAVENTGGNTIAIGFEVDVTAGHASDSGTVEIYGVKQDLDLSTDNGTARTMYGFHNTLYNVHATAIYGIWQKVSNGHVDIRCVSSANVTDYFDIATGANGATTLSTVDTTGGNDGAHLTLDAEGTVDINSVGVLTLDSGAAINIEPASGSAILLDGTVSVDGGSVTGITTLGLDSVSLTAIQISSESFVDNDASIMTSAAIEDKILSYSYTDDQTAGEILTLIEDGIDSVHYKDGSIDNVHLADDAVGADELAANAVVNASITSDAAIAHSKLAALAATKVLVGNGSNVATAVALSGDVTMDNAGSVTVGTLNQSTSGTAAIATTVTLTDNEDADEENPIWFSAGAAGSGNIGAEADGTLTYNPSSGTLTTTTLVGAHGNADSAVQPADTFYIGTTSIAHNRGSGELTLAGLTLTTPDIGTPSAGTLTNCTFPTLNQNTSGTAATVTGSAQTAIESLGTLTALTVDDVTIDGKVITMTGSTDDTFTVTVATHGVTTLATTDAAVSGTAADLILQADGFAKIKSVATENIILDSGYDIILDATTGLYKFHDDSDPDDYFSFRVEGGTGATTMATTSSGTVGHLNFIADGHVEFDGCAVGFDLETPTYNASDTDVSFITGNKQFLTFDGGNITDLNLIFPETSGNFVLLLKQDGTGGRTVTFYKAWDLVNSDAADGSTVVKFAGGSNPNLSDAANHVDIISFFWDADNQIAYGVASLDFQF